MLKNKKQIFKNDNFSVYLFIYILKLKQLKVKKKKNCITTQFYHQILFLDNQRFKDLRTATTTLLIVILVLFNHRNQ